MIIEKILQDIQKIEKLLDEYYVLVYKEDFSEKQELSEDEILTKESIIADIQALIFRLEKDIQSLSQSDCKSEKQQATENRNLVDLVGEVKHTLKRLKRFGVDDEDVKKLFERLKNDVNSFKQSLNKYIEKSKYKIFSWSEAQKQNDEEEKKLDEDFLDLLM
ncbi:MAG: hypothetical protein MJZ50_03820 [Treponema sp.]|nr:hypothetical protein [Treponema sp.]